VKNPQPRHVVISLSVLLPAHNEEQGYIYSPCRNWLEAVSLETPVHQ
jgi:hypothetical protein